MNATLKFRAQPKIFQSGENFLTDGCADDFFLDSPRRAPFPSFSANNSGSPHLRPNRGAKPTATTGADGESGLLDRTDRGNYRRRGTDIVRVQQTRAVKGGRKQPSIYLSELGPRRMVTQLKWFISTVIVAVSGLAIIGVVIYTSTHSGDNGNIFRNTKREILNSLKPRVTGKPGSLKQTSTGYKAGQANRLLKWPDYPESYLRPG